MLSGVSGWITKAAGNMSSKMPTLGKWLSKSVSTVGKAVSWVAKFLGKILGTPGNLAGKAGEAIQGTKLGTKVLGKNTAINLGAGTKSATNTVSLMGGMEYAAKGNKNKFSLGNIKPEFSYEDI